MEPIRTKPVLVEWLKSQQRDANPFKFRVVDIREGNPPTPELIDFLSEEYIVANISPKALKIALSKLKDDCGELNLQKFQEFVEGNLTGEEKISTLVGSFGEIISTIYLVQFEKYWLPVYKLRYREKKNWAMRMTDVFVVNTEDIKKPIVSYGEVKTNTSGYKGNIGVEGHDSIKRDNALENPDILRFIINTLCDQNKEDEASFFIEIQLKMANYEIKHKLFLVHDTKFWKDEILENLDACELDSALQDFTVYAVLIDNLKTVIDESFKNSWREAEVIANGK
ncbi:MAG: DUF1837 domain-containing protein [Chloroflexi bacterium]|nr:DUF1837 domain-containing protein [Chloroflexota bacterium]